MYVPHDVLMHDRGSGFALDVLGRLELAPFHLALDETRTPKSEDHITIFWVLGVGVKCACFTPSRLKENRIYIKG